MDERETMRQFYRAAREALSTAQRHELGEAIGQRLMTVPEVAQAQTIFCYVAIGAEVRTRPLIEGWLDEGRTVAIPRIVRPGEMEAHRLERWDELVPGRFGVPTLRDVRLLDAPINVCITPCVAVSPAGDRLGMGAGYYDRYLARHAVGLRVALAYEVQVAPAIAAAAHDVAMDMVITERRILRRGD